MISAPHMARTQLGVFYMLSALAVICGILAFQLVL
jgi:hypothetical protein